MSQADKIWTIRDSNPGEAKRFFSSPKRPHHILELPSLLFNWYRSCFTGLMRPKREVDLHFHLYAFMVWRGKTWPFLVRSQICEKRLLPLSCMSAGTTRLPLDGFLLTLIFARFSKICRENSSFIKIWQEQQLLYMKANTHFFIISRSILLRMRNVIAKSCRGNQKIFFVK
jgi:hypothetical protein